MDRKDSLARKATTDLYHEEIEKLYAEINPEISKIA